MNAQLAFIQQLQNSLPPHATLAQSIADTLNCSIDAAYRRIRGTTELSLNETLLLCNAYHIPLDSISTAQSNVLSFETNELQATGNFDQYLNRLQHSLQRIASYPESYITYASEDLPVFYHFIFPSLAKFKMIYWNKSLLNLDQFQTLKVEEIEISEAWNEKINRINELFSQINVNEIWTEDTIKSTLQQIKFYWEAGFFGSKEFALDVCNELKNILVGINRQAELGQRLNIQKMQVNAAKYNLYISDLMIGNNTVLVQINDTKLVYLGYNTFDFIITSNTQFSTSVHHWLSNIQSKSTLVSNTGEKHRNQFFKKLIKSVEELVLQIQNDTI